MANLQNFKAADFVLVDGEYVSPAVKLTSVNAAIEVRVSEQTTVKLQRGIGLSKFYDVPDSEQIVDEEDMFNVTDGTPGQFIRISCTAVPDVCNILT
ncbi:hypothetical protein C8N47_11177 [Mangrovibacterium marinum]|uniref:Uncharacterized protein n=1 Tax=Mangrovibacterium marinum TaxID=1639118 RepID=A0A2T5C0F9_9BACT|nr:hypothetical protein [Mangrovibacterium marinum]PTN08037.1 hypothetical protein C8N47_11177 [Mangrovibacterium marinum]